jgi:hypothetical protein
LVVIALVIVAGVSAVWAGASEVTVPVKEDVGVRSNAPTTDYSKSLALYAGTATTTVYRTYLKFDLSALPEDVEVTQARLVAWSRRVAANATRIAVFPGGDSWAESAVTWATAPAPVGTALDDKSLPAGSAPAQCVWDVTAAVVAEASGDGVVTLVLAETNPPEGSWAWFADRLDGVVPGATLELQVREAAPKDVTPPTIGLTVLKDALWPPNHALVRCATVEVTDDLDKSPVATVEVDNSEAAGAKGSGNTDPDVAIKPAGEGKWEVWLRAERAGSGEGRAYTIRVKAQDAAGNASSATATVSVAHDQGKR